MSLRSRLRLVSTAFPRGSKARPALTTARIPPSRRIIARDALQLQSSGCNSHCEADGTVAASFGLFAVRGLGF